MIDVRVSDHALEVEGHAGLMLERGDPVCAGVSALFWALVYGLRDVACVEAAVETGRVMRIDWPPDAGPEADAIIRTIVGSLREVASRYPGQVRIREAVHGP